MKSVARRARASYETLERRQLMSGTPTLSADVGQLVFGDVVGGTPSAARIVRLTNTGSATLTIPAGGIAVAGDAAAQFEITGGSADSDLVLDPGASRDVAVRFGATQIGPQGAVLQVMADDAIATTVALRGLGTAGEQGSLEPSFQWILDTYQIKSRTGDLDPAEATLDLLPGPNDEIEAQFFKKAGPGPVSIVPIAVYSGEASPALTLGYYFRSSPSALLTRTQIYTVPSPDVQTMNPRVTGNSTFDPGPATFGLYSTWAAQNGRTVYTEDSRNTFISGGLSRQRMFKTYPLINADGSVEPNAYVIGNEEAFNNDYQDAVFIIRNVTPATAMPTANPNNAATGLMLVNADTKQDIAPITAGGTIDLAQLGVGAGTRLTIRAVVDGTAASVRFSGAGILSRTDNNAPYTLTADAGSGYATWTPTIGNHTLTVTPYSAANATGNAGFALTVNFTVVNTTTTPTPTPTPPPTPTPTPPPTPTPTEPVTLRPAADAYVRDGSSAGQNFGSSGELQLKKSSAAGSSREFYLKFDLSSVASVAGAKLRLNGIIHSTTQTPQVGVFAASGTGWSETGINWNNRPSVPAGASPLATVTVAGSTATWYEFDLTEHLAAEKLAGRSTVTLVVRSMAATDPYLIFTSDEATANRPELVVTPGPTETPTPTPTPPPTPTPGTTTSLAPIADGYGRDGSYAGQNFGSASQLQLKQQTAGWNRESFLKFDLTQLTTVSSAKLRLYGQLDNTSSASVQFAVFASTNTAWDESTATWNNRPTATGSALATGTVAGTSGQWVEVDLTAYLQQQKAAGATSVTLVLKAAQSSNSTILFHSDEGANRPQLAVTA